MATETPNNEPKDRLREEAELLLAQVDAMQKPKTRPASRKPEIVHDHVLAGLISERPASIKFVENSPRNASRILFGYLTSGLDFMHSVVNCPRVPVTVRASAAQILINAGLELFRRNTGNVNGRSSDSQAGDAVGIADKIDQDAQSGKDQDLGLAARPIPDDEPDLPAASAPDPNDTWEHATAGVEDIPVPGNVVNVDTDSVESAIRVQRWFREGVERVLRRKGPIGLKDLEDLVVNNTRFKDMDWKSMLQGMLESGAVLRETGRRDNRRFFYLPHQKPPE